MSVTDEPGDPSRPVPEDTVDQDHPITNVPIEAQDASLSTLVYTTNQSQGIIPKVNVPSREHGVLPLEHKLEEPAKLFPIHSEPGHVPLDFPHPEAKKEPYHTPFEDKMLPHPEVEKGIRESQKIYQQRNKKVISSEKSFPKQPRRRRSKSEGSTPDNILEKEHSSTQEASNDGYVQQQNHLQQLYIAEKQKRENLESEVASHHQYVQQLENHLQHYKGLYIAEKQKRENLELEVVMLRQEVYKRAVLTPAMQVERNDVCSDQKLPDEDLPADLHKPIQVLQEHVRSLAQPGKGRQRECNVCFKEKPIDSHYISKGVLEETSGICQSILVVDQLSLAIASPRTLTEKLECKVCDRSTSYHEGEFKKRLLVTDHYKPGTGLHEDDALVLLFWGHRFLSTRNVIHYAVQYNVAIFEDLQAFMVDVWKVRNKLLQLRNRVPQITCQESTKLLQRSLTFDPRNRVLFYVCTTLSVWKSNHTEEFRIFTESDPEYRIILTLCKVDLTDLDQSLDRCSLIYFQALHCCWAVLLSRECIADKIQSHFPKVVNAIDNHLSQERIDIRGIVRKRGLVIKVKK